MPLLWAIRTRSVGVVEVRMVRPARVRWDRLARPVACWFRNRWHWRRKRQVRADTERWKRIAVPLKEMDVNVDPAVRRLAETAEGLGYSFVLHLGYGMGEAVVVAATREPGRVRPFIDAACRFSDDQLRGADTSPEGRAAVKARNALLVEVRKVISGFPKTSQPNADSS